jgi:signal transduction histidine kinase
MLSGRSIRQRLMRILLATSSVVVTVTCVAFLAHQVITFRRTTLDTLETLGRLIAANSTAALAFRNEQDATETLSALRAEPHVVAAALYDEGGKLFAVYTASRASITNVPPAPGEDGYRFEGARLTGYEPVAQPGAARLGTLYLESDLDVLFAALRVTAISAVGVIAVSLLLAYVLSRRLQRTISQPILVLAETAASVSNEHDYSVRAPKVSADELGQLTDAFNHMLSRIEEQDRVLRTAVHARDVFIGVASHELRTPLTSLHLQLARLRRATAGVIDEQQRERMAGQLTVVERQADRLAQLVENLLDVSRAISGRFELSFEEFDLSDAVQELISRIRDQAARAGCALEIDVEQPCSGRWDRLRVEQVLTNLLSNAIKFGQAKPIRITLRAGPEHVHLSIRDEGIGIAPEDQERIFERFEQARTPRPFGGLGLGLWIVRRIVTAMGGSISVSSSPGTGAEFTITLPRVPMAPVTESGQVVSSNAEKQGAMPS